MSRKISARIRSVKPEIWLSPQVMELSRDARLLFVGLITQADDEGRGIADLRRLKAQLFPGDDLPAEKIREWLSELTAQGLVALYEAPGHGSLYQLLTFNAHQKINRPTASRFPEPHGSLTESSVNTPGALTPDRKGSDKKGSDRTGPDAERSGADGTGDMTGPKQLGVDEPAF